MRWWPVYRQLLVWICLAGYVPTDANSLLGYLANCDNIRAKDRVEVGAVKPWPGAHQHEVLFVFLGSTIICRLYKLTL